MLTFHSNPQSWHGRVADGRTTILANFRDADPNRELAEINVREMIFMPEITGLKYITVDTDINGAKRTGTVAGPLAEVVAGVNRIEWVLRRTGM